MLCDYRGETLNSKLPNPCTLFNYITDLLFSIIIIIVFHCQHFIHISVLCSISLSTMHYFARRQMIKGTSMFVGSCLYTLHSNIGETGAR